MISAAREDEQTTNNEIERANVIILVYVVYNMETIKRLKSYWIPRILKINDRIPIILVGNKVDLRSSNHEPDLESLLNPYFQEFKQVEMGIECSAKGYMNLLDVIFCAQRAVCFPIAPLFDAVKRKIKPGKYWIKHEFIYRIQESSIEDIPHV